MTGDEIMLILLAITSLAGAIGTLWMSRELKHSADRRRETISQHKDTLNQWQDTIDSNQDLIEVIRWQEAVIRTLLTGSKPPAKPVKADRRIEA